MVGGSALQFPAGWVSSDPSFGVLHDWIEFTFNDAGMFCNTTMVDMFSIPLSVSLSSPSPFTKAKGLPRLRAHWVRPEIFVHVAFIEWTVHRKLRHSRLLGVAD